MLKYVTKFMSDVLPSVIATIIGAYIVNHYITTKPDAPAAAVESKAESKKTDDVAATRSGDAPADALSTPDSRIKSAADKSAAEKPAADKANARHQPAPRDKTVAKVATPAPSAATPASTAPAPAAPVTTTASLPSAPAVEPAAAAEERRDANDLARAAIERLRSSSEASRASEASVARAQDTTSRIPDASRAAAPTQPYQPMQPLPPAVTVAVPASVSVGSTSPSINPAAPPAARVSDGGDMMHRPSPPAEIPSPPIDLHAEAGAPPRTTVAEDVLSAAKSVFHAVLPR
jgi:hypothetical protein